MLPEGVISAFACCGSCPRLFRGQTILDPRPDLIADDLESRPVLGHKLVLVIAPALPLTRDRVFHSVVPVPDKAADVKRISEEAIDPLRPASD